MQRPLASCDWKKFETALDEKIEVTDDISLFSKKAIDKRCVDVNSSITAALDIACPMRPVIREAFRVKPSTLALIREKRKLRRLVQRTDNKLLKNALNNLNGRITRAIAKEKQEAWQNATEDLNSFQGAKLWKQFHSLTGSGRSLRTITKLEDATGGERRGEDEIAATFASHLEQSHRMHEGPLYCEETRKTVDQKINSNIRIFTPCFPPAKDEQGDDHFLAEPFMPDDISSALKRCKSKTAAGGDRINYTTLKHTTPKLIGILAQLFTICFMVGYFPVAWKSATGIMLLKEGSQKARKLPTDQLAELRGQVV